MLYYRGFFVLLSTKNQKLKKGVIMTSTKYQKAVSTFLNEVKNMTSNELIKLPCSSGGCVHIERVTPKHYNVFYTPKNCIQPTAVSTTDYLSLEMVINNMTRVYV